MGIVTKQAPFSLKSAGAFYPDQKPAQAEGDQRMVSSGAVTIANGDSATSKIFLGQMPSNAIPNISDSILHHGAVTGVNDFDIGLYQAGTLKDIDILADGLDITSAGTKLIFNSIPLADIGKPLWLLLGLPSDPGVMYDVVATLKVDASATASVNAQIKYAR